MQFNTAKFAAVVADAKAKAANDVKWTRAIEKAASGLLNESLIVTVCGAKSLVTSINGQYWVSDRCACPAAQHRHAQCVHRAAVRLVELYDARPADVEIVAIAAPAPQAKTLTRTIERQYRGDKVTVVRYDGWAV